MKGTCGVLVAVSGVVGPASTTRDLLSSRGYAMTPQTMKVDEEEMAFRGAGWDGIRVLPSSMEDTPALKRAEYSKAQPAGDRNSCLQQGQRIRKRHHLSLRAPAPLPRVGLGDFHCDSSYKKGSACMSVGQEDSL